MDEAEKLKSSTCVSLNVYLLFHASVDFNISLSVSMSPSCVQRNQMQMKGVHSRRICVNKIHSGKLLRRISMSDVSY